MSTSSVLAAAAALQRFTAAQLAAYCDEDDQAVEVVLDQHAGLVQQLPDGAGWQVLDTAALRRRLSHQERRSQAHKALAVRERHDQARAGARLLVAEKVLLDCAGEPDAAARRVMAATAHNHLRQCAAAFADGPGSWWEIDPGGDLVVPEVLVDTELITAARLRLDLALARFTGSEAAGGTVGMEELLRAAGEVDELPVAMGRRSALVSRFASLSSRVLRLPHGSLSQSAPARFLATVAVRRAADEATRHGTAGHLIRLLNGLAHEPALRHDGSGSRLFRIIDRLPAGRARVAVYADLVPLLPAGFHWARTADPLPGAVVEGVADNRAQRYLSQCAQLLETDLAESPFSSESALIGQAAYILDQLTMGQRDGPVRRRAELTRGMLLSLAGVPVG